MAKESINTKEEAKKRIDMLHEENRVLAKRIRMYQKGDKIAPDGLADQILDNVSKIDQLYEAFFPFENKRFCDLLNRIAREEEDYLEPILEKQPKLPVAKVLFFIPMVESLLNRRLADFDNPDLSWRLDAVMSRLFLAFWDYMQTYGVTDEEVEERCDKFNESDNPYDFGIYILEKLDSIRKNLEDPANDMAFAISVDFMNVFNAKSTMVLLETGAFE